MMSQVYFRICKFLKRWSESTAQNRHELTILYEYCQNALKCDHLKTENLPYNPLYLSSGSKRSEPDSKYSDLIGNMPAFNCLYLFHYFLDRAEVHL